MAEPVEIRVGDVWRDLDPRGGPTFRVMETPTWIAQRVTVEALDGKRRRTVARYRFRAHDGYRSGYTLVSRQEDPDAG